MIEISNNCIKCEACFDVCPVLALGFNPSKSKVQCSKNCIKCEACVDACPTLALKLKNKE